MIDSDTDAKALLEKEEKMDSGDDQNSEFEDRETNQYKKFQLDYERTKSVID